MFTIIGGDGKEYGPVSTSQIQSWIAAGRANLDTQAKAVGSEEWRRLRDYPEFNGGLEPGSPPVIVNENELAGRGTRFAAKVVDEFISILCVLPGCSMLGFSFVRNVITSGGNVDLDPESFARMFFGMAVLVIGLLAISIVQIVLLSMRGQTIAKIIFGIRIVGVRDNQKAGFLRAWFLRSFVPGVITMIPTIGFIFSLIDACFIFGAHRRCVHDYIAGTKVVKV